MHSKTNLLNFAILKKNQVFFQKTHLFFQKPPTFERFEESYYSSRIYGKFASI